jgi:uncharacterized SAM-binding protein YcdF (DUF218 family)
MQNAHSPDPASRLAVNDLLATFGLLDWKPAAAALLLPPVPLLLMLLLAWWWQRRHPATATALLLTAVLGLWFSHCQITGELLERELAVAPTLSTQRLAELRRGTAEARTAIVVLSGGVRPLASEYGESHPAARSMERLQYGLWLARQVPASLLVAGGTGWAQTGGPAESAVLARIASRDLGRTVRWTETESHDTRGMARFSLQQLHKDGIAQVVLVTHGWHMRRALRAFTEEAALATMPLKLVPAPMGLVADRLLPPLQRWAPTTEGHQRVRQALREWIALAAGA